MPLKMGRSLVFNMKTINEKNLNNGAIKLFCPWEIKDSPRFKYRGMHLDVGRHIYVSVWDFI